MRIHLVHDYLVVRGGAERTLLALSDLFPEAPIHVAIFRPETTFAEFGARDVRPLWPSRVPVGLGTYRALIAAYALAFERLRLPEAEVALSHSTGFAKAAGRDAGCRLAMVMAPPRFLWPVGESSAPQSWPERVGRALMTAPLRRLDLAAARRADRMAANSAATAARIAAVYARQASVIHPPLAPLFSASEGGDAGGSRHGFLTVGRLVTYKRHADAVRWATATGEALTVVGDGPELARLRALAGPGVEFAGSVGDLELRGLYERSEALIQPGEEDFGLGPIEAAACGCATVARRCGGALESVVDGVTGVLYEGAGGLGAAVRRLRDLDLDRAAMVDHARGFGRDRFDRQVREFVAGPG